jgi:DNA-binding response OmpR family regulator
LVVEDEHDIAEARAARLKAEGFEVLMLTARDSETDGLVGRDRGWAAWTWSRQRADRVRARQCAGASAAARAP